MLAGLNSVYYMLHYTKTCKFRIQDKCQINGQFSKKSDKNICFIEWFANGIEKSANFLSRYYRNSASKCCYIGVDIL